MDDRRARVDVRRKNASQTPRLNTSGEGTLFDLVDHERGRLMKAEAILHCVAIAMEAGDGSLGVEQHPDYLTLVDLAREIIKEAIGRLDSVRLRSGREEVDHSVGLQVKEGAVGYVH